MQNNEQIKPQPTQEEIQELEMQQQQPQEPQPQQKERDEFDYTDELNELEGVEKELQDIESSIEGNFATWITEVIDSDQTLEDLFFNDRKTFFKKILELQNQFVKELVEPRIARAQELDSKIKSKSELGKIDMIKKQFQKEHPDVNIQELIMFYTQELPPKVQEAIKAEPVENFFNIIYELYMQSTQPQEPQQQPQQPEDPLPKQAQGVAVSSEEADSNSGYLPMERY